MRKLILLLFLPIASLWAQEDWTATSINTRVLVKDRFAQGDEIVRWAMEHKGYFTQKNPDYVTLRIPDREVPEFRTFLEELSQESIGWDLRAVDLRGEIQRNQSSLQANTEILKKNIQYLDSSDVEGTLTLEKEIRRLMSRIDASKGLLRKLENDRRYAQITVQMSFVTNTLPQHIPSPFDWINLVNFFSFLKADMYSDAYGYFGPNMAVPEGFALVDKKPVFKALSPEGIRLRVRRVDNYPQQNLEFWEKALKDQLQKRGYIPFEKETIPDFLEKEGFSVSIWGVRSGTMDYLYLIGIRIRGSKIEIMELAGETEYVLGLFP